MSEVRRDDGGTAEPLERLSVHGLPELAADVYAHRAHPDVRAADRSGRSGVAGVRVTAWCEGCGVPDSDCRCSGPCSRDRLCRACTVRWLLAADARGDGPLVNALCA